MHNTLFILGLSPRTLKYQYFTHPGIGRPSVACDSKTKEFFIFLTITQKTYGFLELLSSLELVTRLSPVNPMRINLLSIERHTTTNRPGISCTTISSKKIHWI
jgi:hypothetical protein